MDILGKALRHSVHVVTFVAFTITLTGCVATTGQEARLEFAERIQQYGSNPYIQVSVFNDLERRIRAIATEGEIGPDVRELGPRQEQILSNFSDRYDHAKLKQNMRMARTDFDFITRANYPNIGTETGCKIDTSNTRFPRDTKNQTPATFKWVFMHGECKDGVAHGIGRARAVGNTKFVGEFDQGRMVQGVFETFNIKGERLVAIGDVPSTDLIGRTLVAVFNKNGFQWFRYADFNGMSKFDGFAINIWSYPKITVVRFVGDFKDHVPNGFAAKQARRNWGDGKVWNTWIGVYKNGKLNGPAAWTNAVEEVTVGEWNNSKLNGVGYTQYNDATGDYHMFDACNYIDGRRQGMCKVFHSNNFNSGEHVWERYNNGEMVDASYHQTAFSLSQILAFSMGAAIISAADAPSAAKMQVGQALFQDTLGGGGGSNLAALKQSYEEQAQRAQSSSTSSATSGSTSTASAGSGMTTEQVNISCPSGVSNTIPITYRTRACFVAAKQFAETYSCNKFDYERVATNCQRLCGHPQCLQK